MFSRNALRLIAAPDLQIGAQPGGNLQIPVTAETAIWRLPPGGSKSGDLDQRSAAPDLQIGGILN